MTRLQHIQQTIADTAQACGRNPQDITLIAVSKGQSINAILAAYQSGITHFGESYWQEARDKIAALAHLPITWHFIGPIQSNKTKDIATHFDWVHSVDREKIARLLAQHRTLDRPPLNICIQVNLDEEPSKAGIQPNEVPPLARLIHMLPQLKLRGLMGIPQPQAGLDAQIASLSRLSQLKARLNQTLSPPLDTLSMGMSNDFIAAIRSGSTMLRIGQAIFGERIKKN